MFVYKLLRVHIWTFRHYYVVAPLQTEVTIFDLTDVRKLHVVFLMNTFTCVEVSAGSQRLSVWRLGYYNTSLTGSNFISRAPEKHEKTQKRDSERNTEF